MREFHLVIAEQKERVLPLIQKRVSISSEQKGSGARNSDTGWTLSYVSIDKGVRNALVIKEK